MVGNHLKNPQAQTIQQSASRSKLSTWSSDVILKDILSDEWTFEWTGLPGRLQQEEACGSSFWLDNQWKRATSQLIQTQLIFFFQNYQSDLPLDKCVRHLFRHTVLCLIKSTLVVFINRHEPSAWCWWNPLQTSQDLTRLNSAGLGNWCPHSEGRAQTHKHLHQMLAELWESTKAIFPKAISQWQQVRTATVAP